MVEENRALHIEQCKIDQYIHRERTKFESNINDNNNNNKLVAFNEFVGEKSFAWSEILQCYLTYLNLHFVPWINGYNGDRKFFQNYKSWKVFYEDGIS